jgi:cytochrome c
MQKIYFTAMMLFAMIFYTRCVSERVQTERDLQQLLPPVPASFSKADSARLIANWTLGIKMYKSNCSRCHGIFGNGKDSIPNFSKEQYDEYKTSYLAGDSANHAVISKMTEDELNDVFLFLTDLKR